MAGSLSIGQLLEAFLAEQRGVLSIQTYGGYTTIVDLLRGSLNRFAYASLTSLDRARWEQRFDSGDSEAYCNVFGAQELLAELPPFRAEHLVRRIGAGELLLELADRVTDDLVAWLCAHGYAESGSHAGRPGQ
jgi:hypothetical protein